MRWIVCCAPLLISACRTQPPAPDPQAEDRAAIEKVIKEYKDTDHKIAPDRGPWSEVTAPVRSVVAITFPERNTALVEVLTTQYGTTLGFIRTQVRVTMKKEEGKWAITEVRGLG
jgi:hypothetical protein